MTGKQDFRLNLKRSFLERREGKRRRRGADRGREGELGAERKWKSKEGREEEREKESRRRPEKLLQTASFRVPPSANAPEESQAIPRTKERERLPFITF